MIKNPEISALVPTLLMGLTDPNDYTKYSLDILLQVRFMDVILNFSTSFIFVLLLYCSKYILIYCRQLLLIQLMLLHLHF